MSHPRTRWVERDGERILVTEEVLDEAAVFKEILHPRNREGRWIEVLGKLSSSAGRRHGGNVSPASAGAYKRREREAARDATRRAKEIQARQEHAFDQSRAAGGVDWNPGYPMTPEQEGAMRKAGIGRKRPADMSDEELESERRRIGHQLEHGHYDRSGVAPPEWGLRDRDDAIRDEQNLRSKGKRAGRTAAAPDLGDLKVKPLSDLADIIRRDWGPKVNYAAVPYLDAMRSLGSVEDNYGMDSGRSIVAYFLSNASTWRGPVAKQVKAELKRRLKR